MNSIYKKIFDFDISNSIDEEDNINNNSNNNQNNNISILNIMINNKNYSDNDIESTKILRSFLVYLNKNYVISEITESPKTVLFPEMCKQGVYTSTMRPIETGKWMYELIPARTNGFKFGWAICKTSETLGKLLPKSYTVIDKIQKKFSIPRPDGIVFSCTIDVSSKLVSYYSNGIEIYSQELKSYKDELNNDNNNNNSTTTTVTNGGEEYQDNKKYSIFYIPYVALETSVAQPNFGGRPLSINKFENYKTIIEENKDKSKRAAYLVSVFLNVLSLKDLLPLYKEILIWLTPILITNLTLYTVESILVESLYNNLGLIDDFIEALNLNTTEELFKHTMKQIFSKITIDCRPTPFSTCKSLHLFYRLVQNPISLQYFLLDETNLLILDYIFSKESIGVNEDRNYKRDIRSLEEKERNTSRVELQKHIFNYCMTKEHSLFYNDLFELTKDWLVKIIDQELNHDKEVASGKSTSELYPFTFLFHIFNMLAENMEHWLLNDRVLASLPLSFLTKKAYDSSNRQRLGGVLSHLLKSFKKPITIMNGGDGYQEEEEEEELDFQQESDIEMVEILINLFDISICKQFQRIDSHPSNILRYFFIDLDFSTLIRALNIEGLKYNAVQKEISEEMVTTDYIWLVFKFLTKFLNRVLLLKEEQQQGTKSSSSSIEYIDFVYDHFMTSCITVFSYFAETDKSLLLNSTNLKTSVTFISILFKMNNHIVDRQVSQKVSMAIIELLKIKNLLVIMHNLPSFPTMIKDLFINLGPSDLVIFTLLFDASLPSFLVGINSLFQNHGIYLLKLLKSLYSQIPQNKKLINLLSYLSNKMSHLILEDETFLMITGQFYLYIFEKISLVSMDEKKSYVKLFYKLLPSIYYFSQYQSKSNKLSFSKSIKKIDINDILKVLDEFSLNGSNYKVKKQQVDDGNGNGGNGHHYQNNNHQMLDQVDDVIIPDDDEDYQQDNGYNEENEDEVYNDQEEDEDDDDDDDDELTMVGDPETNLNNLMNSLRNIDITGINPKFGDKSLKEKNERFDLEIDPVVKEKLIIFFKSIDSGNANGGNGSDGTNEDGSNDESENLCTICYSQQEDTEFSPCKHRSCHHCIILHLLTKTTCFFCRNNIYQFYYVDSNGNSGNSDESSSSQKIEIIEPDTSISIEQQEIENKKSIDIQLSQQLLLHRNRLHNQQS